MLHYLMFHLFLCGGVGYVAGLSLHLPNPSIKRDALRRPLCQTLGVMSPTEIYDEFAIEFPPVWPEDHEWENVHDGQAARLDAISTLLDRYISSSEVVVIVHSNPGVGAVLPRKTAPGYIAEHVPGHEIQVSDPLYTCFVAVSSSGVATGWVAATHKPVPYRFPNDA